MYKKTINDIKDYIIKDKKLTYLEVLNLSFRFCIVFYTPGFVSIFLIYIINKLFT